MNKVFFTTLLGLLLTSTTSWAHESTMPTPGAPKDYTPPSIEVADIKEGVRLIYVHNKTTPLTRLSLVSWHGVANEAGAGESGLSLMAAKLIKRATATQTTDEVLQTFQRLAADVSVSTRVDHTQVSVDVLSETLNPTLTLIDDLLTNPKLDDGDLERIRREQLQNLIQEADQPRVLGYRKFFEVVYAGHPMERWRTGTPDALKAVSSKRVLEWNEATWQRSTFDIVVVSSLSRPDIENAIRTQLKDLLAAHTATKRAPMAKLAMSETNESKLVWVDKPGSSQSVLLLGKAAHQSTELREARELGNAVLGGQFSSRINLNLREDKGYTYGAYSSIMNFEHGSTFFTSTSVRADVTAASLTEMLNELRQISNERPITSGEFREVKTSKILKWPASFSPGSRLIGTIVSLLREGRDPKGLTSEAELLKAVTIDTAQKSLSDVLKNKYPWVLIIVGDKAKWEASVSDLKWDTKL